jgi:hypothetical protein
MPLIRQDPGSLATICPACHVRMHGLAAVPTFIQPCVLWAAPHPDARVHLDLSFGLVDV